MTSWKLVLSLDCRKPENYDVCGCFGVGKAVVKKPAVQMMRLHVSGINVLSVTFTFSVDTSGRTFMDRSL